VTKELDNLAINRFKSKGREVPNKYLLRQRDRERYYEQIKKINWFDEGGY
jgi:hypothetical protein